MCLDRDGSLETLTKVITTVGCCDSGEWCYAGGCCPLTDTGCEHNSCCPPGANCCKGYNFPFSFVVPSHGFDDQAVVVVPPGKTCPRYVGAYTLKLSYARLLYRQYCDVVDGQSGCCENGSICTVGPSGQCADSGYSPCATYDFCCRECTHQLRTGIKCVLMLSNLERPATHAMKTEIIKVARPQDQIRATLLSPHHLRVSSTSQ